MDKRPVAKDTDLMFFGKHKGTPIKDVPADYLDWAIGQEWFVQYVALYNYIIDNEKVLDSEFSEKVEKTDSKPEEDTPW